jgi:predicted O-linked N-acetylglucosamine transferase (SPINDLY family)
VTDAKEKRVAALRFQREGNLDEAARLFGEAVAADPDDATAHNMLGVVSIQRRDLTAANAHFRRAAELSPSDEAITCNYASLLVQTGQFAAAMDRLDRLQSPPAGAVALYLRIARALQGSGQEDRAAKCRRRLGDVPEIGVQALQELTMLAIDAQDFDFAILIFERLLKLGDESAALYNNYGAALDGAGRTADAVEALRRALSLDPALATAAIGLGPLLYRLGRHREAIEAFEAALSLQPENANLRMRLAHTRLAICDWTDWPETLAFLERSAASAASAGSISPFASVFWPISNAARLQIATGYARRIANEAAALGRPTTVRPGGDAPPPLRIGYMSAGFANHATGHLMRGMFKRHDRDRFHITGFAISADDGSDYRRDIAAGCDAFHDLTGLSDRAALDALATAGLHILVDLAGYTQQSRPRLVATRPAPVQVNYLGFPGTLGTDYIDYIVTDRIVTPPSDAPFYAESLAYMPDCYLVNDDAQPIADHPDNRAEAGLPEDAIVFATFNSPRKIEPMIFGLWMRILEAVPDSVLWAYRPNAEVEERLRREAESNNIGADRLVFAPPLPKAQHLARLRLADLFLDTHYCCAHTTASDALWVGLPVLAFPFDSFAGRVSASLLRTIGRPDLIAKTAEDYVDRAVALARAPERLREIRGDLLAKRVSSPVFDTDRWVRNLERLFEEMWRIHAAGAPPRQIEITGDTA